jgi:hypothetical protein
MMFFSFLAGLGSLSANPITVHNTGVNAADVLQPIGATTSYWTLVSEPATASEALGSNPFRYYNIAYFADDAVSGWVSPTASGNAGVGGFYTYQLTFDLTGFDSTSALISAIFGVDNDGAILLNGNVVATTGFADFATPAAFTMNTGFLAGLNTISGRMDNGGDPSAFRVKFSTATANAIERPKLFSEVFTPVPEPGSGILLTAGLAAMLFVGNRLRPSRPRV